jgi:hypothetical protein
LFKIAREKYVFLVLNILKDPLPKSDLLFCRDFFVHFSFVDIFKALENLKSREIKYLLTIINSSLKKNKDIATREWRPINFSAKPFCFSNPILVVNENYDQKYNDRKDKRLGLWEVKDIKIKK